MNTNMKQITLKDDAGNEVNYIREDAVPQNIESSKLLESIVGKNVLVRSSRNEGINAGTVVAADETGIALKNARRLWYHRPKDSGLSWYEGVANSGLSDDSKVSSTVSMKIIVEDYSVIICSDSAFADIMEKTPHAQS